MAFDFQYPEERKNPEYKFDEIISSYNSNFSKIDSLSNWTIDFMDSQTISIYAPYNLSISAVTNIVNSPSLTIQDDGTSYSIGSIIDVGSKIGITASTASVVTLIIERDV
jgi:hypothetical protein